MNKLRLIKDKKKIFKIISISLIGCLSVGLITGFSVDWSRPDWIYISGSSTMQQFLESISNIYSPAEIIVDAGGSSVGIENLVNNKKNIASVSKTPSTSTAGIPEYNSNPSIIGKYQSQWVNKNFKTVTVAFDGIGIIYKNKGILKDKEVIITPKTILWLYLAFCGNNYINGINLIPGNWELDISDVDNNLVPFSRSGGSIQSGTAESFLVDSRLLDNSKSTLSSLNAFSNSIENTIDTSKSIYNILNSGQYGKNTIITSESNLQTWMSIKQYSGSGIPITYLSSGFIKNNYYDIINAGFNIAKYSINDDGSDAYSLLNISDNNFSDNIAGGYDWYRPLNLILSNDSNDYIKEFIEWILGNMLFENSSVYKLYNEQGFIPLDVNTIKTMFNPNDSDGINMIDEIYNYAHQFPNRSYDEYAQNHTLYWNNFWSLGSDYSLIQSNQYDSRKNNEIWYGAYKLK